ncbi:hypothetical protein [Streptomyces sp. NPDC005336]|uniref:hypothetical protein n=1 Tax=unclassified Streptomyces TaxID=2593676 RepID=UPI0033AC753D
MALFLFLVIVAIALGIVGTVVHGLGYLLVIAAVLFVADVVFAVMRWMRGARRRRVR